MPPRVDPRSLGLPPPRPRDESGKYWGQRWLDDIPSETPEPEWPNQPGGIPPPGPPPQPFGPPDIAPKQPGQLTNVADWVVGHRRQQNFAAARAELGLTPQEVYAYRHHLGNLDRGGVPHPDGSLSSFYNMTVGFGDRTYVLPRVWDNRILDEDAAIARARADGLEKWPSYDSLDAANARYDAMHKYMERDTQGRLNRANPVSQPAENPHDADMGGAQPAIAPWRNRR